MMHIQEDIIGTEGIIKPYPTYKSGNINKAELGRLTALSRNTINKYIEIVEAR
jgi:hypothetical protein